MLPFASGYRVVAINTDMFAPIYGPANPELHPFFFPDGPLRKDLIYHVFFVSASGDGNQRLMLTGIRVFWGTQEMGWNSSRFRKVDTLKGHLPKKRRRKRPVATTCLLTPHLQHRYQSARWEGCASAATAPLSTAVPSRGLGIFLFRFSPRQKTPSFLLTP